MITKAVRIILILTTALSLVTGTVFSAGRPGEIFFYGSGARSFGMGGAYIAVSDDSSAAYWNPAVISEMKYSEASVFMSPLLEGTQYGSLSYVMPTVNKRGLGLNVVYLATPPIEKRDSVNQVLGNFTYSEMGANIAYGQTFNRKLNLGVGLNILQRSIDTSASSLIGTGLSMLWKPSSKGRLGLKLDNILAFSSGDTQDKLPMDARIGYAQQLFNDRLIASFDMEPTAGLWFFGVEMNVKPMFIRLGLNSEQTCAGFGIDMMNNYRFDYALGYNDLAMFHRLSFSMKFGTDIHQERTKTALKYYQKAEDHYMNGIYSKSLLSYEAGMQYQEMPEATSKYRKLSQLVNEVGVKDVKEDDGDMTPMEKKEQDTMKGIIGNYLNDDQRAAGKGMRSALAQMPDSNKLQKLKEIIKSDDKYDSDLPGDVAIGVKLNNAVKFFNEGKYDLSIKECMESLNLDPDNEMAHIRLGSAYYILGLNKKAQDEWDAALRSNPHNADLRSFMKSVGMK